MGLKIVVFMILEYISTCCDRINKRGYESLLQHFNMRFLEFYSKLSNLNELDIDEDFNCDRLVEDNCDLIDETGLSLGR
jgi:hypothetical protein